MCALEGHSSTHVGLDVGPGLHRQLVWMLTIVVEGVEVAESGTFIAGWC
jgi:hypothetical protein